MTTENATPINTLANYGTTKAKTEQSLLDITEKAIASSSNPSEQSGQNEQKPTALNILDSNELSQAEKENLEQIQLNKIWMTVTELMNAESTNTWALGDEFLKLYVGNYSLQGRHLSIEEIAVKVAKSKSWVGSLVISAQFFKPKNRSASHNWNVHDLFRRACERIQDRMNKEKIKSKLKGEQASYLDAIQKSKARTTNGAAEVVLKAAKKDGSITDEQYSVLSSPETKAPKMALYLYKTDEEQIFLFRPQSKSLDQHLHKMDGRNLNGFTSKPTYYSYLLENGIPKMSVATAQQLLDIANGDAEAIKKFKQHLPNVIKSQKDIEEETKPYAFVVYKDNGNGELEELCSKEEFASFEVCKEYGIEEMKNWKDALEVQFYVNGDYIDSIRP